MTDSSAIEDILNEFVDTERSYVKRIRILKHDYADPLRTFARSKDTAIISLYDANTLFGNIDNLLPVNEALLVDLEKMVSPEGPHTVGFIGDVALRHFKDRHGFEQYKQYYVKREEAQSIFEREMSRRSSGFAAFIDVSLICSSSYLFSPPHSESNIHLPIPQTALGYANFSWTPSSGYHATL